MEAQVQYPTLALGLVFATVLIAGPFIHWLIPTIPLSVAFALAAILSPTDAVAVGSLSGRVKRREKSCICLKAKR